MARLTNRQMDVLAERVTDLLEEAHKANTEGVINSDAYKNFETTYSDSTAIDLRKKVAELKELEPKLENLQAQQSRIRREANTIGRELHMVGMWENYTDPSSLLERYLEKKKGEVFPDAAFNREKTLRRVSADILLSDVENPEQLVKSLVEKLKQDERPD